MKRQFWLNIVLLGVIIVLVAVLDYSSNKVSHDIRKPQGLFEARIQDVEHIMIERQGKATLVLAKKKQQWLLIKPALAPINHQRIQHLLTILNEPIQSQLPRKRGDLTLFKLDTERIALTINNEKIIFGMINPVTKNRYILKNTMLYTIKEIVYGTLGSSVTHLLEHRLLAKQLKVTQIDAPARFYKTPQAQEAWNTLEATNIADYAADETILGIVSLTIRNNGQNNEKATSTTLVFDILAIKPTLIVGRADLNVKYTIDKIVVERLLVLE